MIGMEIILLKINSVTLCLGASVFQTFFILKHKDLKFNFSLFRTP